MRTGDVERNRRYWDRESDAYQADHDADLAERALAWGVFRHPELGPEGLNALGPVAGRTVLELGCGAARFGAALAEHGAVVTGLDLSARQLHHARQRAGSLALVQASAVTLPFPGAAFDLVFCDHGALSFCDPAATLPEVARVLRPGGRLAFCLTSPLKQLCSDATWQVVASLERSYDDLGRLEDDDTVEWAPTHGGWVALLTTNGFEVLALHELRPPAEATTTYDWFVPRSWARRWPAEDVWVARRR